MPRGRICGHAATACPAASVLLAVLVLLVLLGPVPARAGDRVVIGLIAPMSGEFYRHGVYCVDAARFAVKQAEKGGGLLIGDRRYQVDLRIRDSRNMPRLAREAARDLVERDKAMALIGPLYSSNALEAEGVCEKAGVPMILPYATMDSLTRGKRFVFRIPYTNTFQGEAVARFVRNRLKKSTAAVVYQTGDPYGEHLAEVFGRAFPKLGGTVSLVAAYPAEARDFKTEFKAVADSGAEVLYMPTPSQVGMIQVRQARRAGFTGVIVGGDSWDGTEMRRVKEAEGAYYCDHWAPDMPEESSKNFVRDYDRASRHAPVEIEALTYDAFGVLFQAMRTAGSVDPKAVAEALRAMEPYQGVTGVIDYTDSGDPATYLIISRIQNGRTEFADMVKP